MLWAGVGPGAGAAGLPVLGLALAPIFPLLIATTPDRVGAVYATHAIGFQVAAFYLGAAVLPGAAGLLARHAGLDVLGPCLLGTAVGLGVLYVIGGGRQPGEARGQRRGCGQELSGGGLAREPGSRLLVSNRSGRVDPTPRRGRRR